MIHTAVQTEVINVNSPSPMVIQEGFNLKMEYSYSITSRDLVFILDVP